MSFFKYIIASFLAFGGADGEWAAVQKPVKPQEQGEEEAPSIWVLFVKNLGEEQFMVRFPDDPEYKTTETGDLQIRSEKSGEQFFLTIRKLEKGVIKKSDSVQFIEGKWAREDTAQSEFYQYEFRTISDQENSSNHKDFVNSLEFFS